MIDRGGEFGDDGAFGKAAARLELDRACGKRAVGGRDVRKDGTRSHGGELVLVAEDDHARILRDHLEEAGRQMDVDHRGLVDDEHVGGKRIVRRGLLARRRLLDEPLVDRVLLDAARCALSRLLGNDLLHAREIARDRALGHRDDRLVHATRGLARRSGKIDGKVLVLLEQTLEDENHGGRLASAGTARNHRKAVLERKPHGLGLEFVGVQGARELLDERGRRLGKRARRLRGDPHERSRKALLLGEEPCKIKSGGKAASAFVEHEGRQGASALCRCARSGEPPAGEFFEMRADVRVVRLLVVPDLKAHAARNVEKPHADAAAVVGAREGGRDGTHEDVHVLAEGLESLRLACTVGDAKKRLAELRKLGREHATGIVGGDVRHFCSHSGMKSSSRRAILSAPTGSYTTPWMPSGPRRASALTPRRNT